MKEQDGMLKRQHDRSYLPEKEERRTLQSKTDATTQEDEKEDDEEEGTGLE